MAFEPRGAVPPFDGPAMERLAAFLELHCGRENTGRLAARLAGRDEALLAVAEPGRADLARLADGLDL